MNGYIQNTTFINDLTAERLAVSGILLLLSSACSLPDIPPMGEVSKKGIFSVSPMGGKSQKAIFNVSPVGGKL
jgi:hypothetical protein